MDKNSEVIIPAIREMGGEVEVVDSKRQAFLIKYKRVNFLITRKFRIGMDFLDNNDFTRFKDLTAELLFRKGLPTPKTVLLCRDDNENDLREKLKELDFPIIVKDAAGSKSKGIFPDIKNINEAINVVTNNLKKFKRLVAQKMVSGREFRVLVLGSKIIGALELVPPSVVGDGESSVNQLIKEKQKMTKSETERNTNLKNLLGDQGESLSSIPEKNKKVFIKNCPCLAEGGMIVDCTEKVNDKIREICVDASMASRLSLAGLDILCDDIEKSPKKQNFTIIEVNGKPDLYIHHNPTNGKPRNVTKEIVEFIVEKFKSLEL